MAQSAEENSNPNQNFQQQNHEHKLPLDYHQLEPKLYGTRKTQTQQIILSKQRTDWPFLTSYLIFYQSTVLKLGNILLENGISTGNCYSQSPYFPFNASIPILSILAQILQQIKFKLHPLLIGLGLGLIIKYSMII